MTNRYDILKTGKSYLPYLMLGYPSSETCLAAAKVLLENGAAGLELGLPFRDPVADGPVIEVAGNKVLDRGFTVDNALGLVQRIRALNAAAPLTVMCYYNMMLARGVDKFAADFAAAGADGILIPDLPLERTDEILPALRAHGLKLIFMASPLTTAARLAEISTVAEGFIYVVTRLGITGAQANYSTQLSELFARVHANCRLPAIAGFGISRPEDVVTMLKAGADGVIVGSRLVEILEDFDVGEVAYYTRAIRDVLQNAKAV